MPKSQDVITKKLPQLLQNLPSQGCLQVCLTEEQKEGFEKMRESNLLVAQALEAKFTGRDSLFDQFLENQGIDPLKRQAIWKTAEEYRALWEVVRLAEPYLKMFYTETATLFHQELQQESSHGIRFLNRISSKILNRKYEFKSPDELFISIVEEEQEMIFIDSSGLNNSDFSVNKTHDVLTSFKFSFLGFGSEVISPYKYKSNIMKVVDYINCNQLYYSWKEMIFFVCFYYIGANPTNFNKKLFFNLCQYYKLILFDIIPLVLRGLRKRDSKTWKKPRSYRWNKGHKIYTAHKAKTLPLTLNESKEENYKDLEKENAEQKSEIEYLKMVIRDREQKIKELECLQDPYSADGDAICNYEPDEI